MNTKINMNILLLCLAKHFSKEQLIVLNGNIFDSVQHATYTYIGMYSCMLLFIVCFDTHTYMYMCRWNRINNSEQNK